MEKINHYSVLLDETINALKIKPDGIYLDATLGLGGHTKAIAKHLTSGKVIAIDQDEYALQTAKEHLSEYQDRIIFVKENFRNLDQILDALKIKTLDGVIYDLGTSYYQLTSKERGFSFQNDLKLDMRMDINLPLSAADILNQASESELNHIFKTYGEVKNTHKLVREIVNLREQELIQTTNQLNDIINTLHHSKRANVYQALRIAVNDEFGALEESLTKVFNYLAVDSIVAVISFHSLEDRIVKTIFQKRRNETIETPKQIIRFYHTFKPIVPSKAELDLNRASRSAKLRIIKKINVQ